MIAAVLLSACAQNPPSGAEGAQSKPAVKAASAEVAKAGSTPGAAVTRADPSLVRFATQSVKLDEQAQAQLPLLLDQASAAKRIVITGYCDRKDIGNAKAAAIARANNVKNALVKLGVPAKKIRVKYSTDEAQHAAKVEFSN
ncbi:OmpA family protein [Jeongeupia sp. USM3]|uniref:OmpA family protein n=1 Tax=Jeongeupia sp. USM3 TaxID=1906741 RepID=UPI00143C0172|nr:OmpA family protein [Jeongeupia sp. USM3]